VKTWYQGNMVDDNIIQQLKAYIREHYELASDPAPEKPALFPTGKKPFGKLAHGIGGRTRPSFMDISDTLSDFIGKERKSETFSVMLDRLRREKGMTPVALYNGAWVKKQLYSKIRGERNYHPSKNTAVAFGMSLRLSSEEMDGLLESTGYRLSGSSITNLVVRFCLDNGLHDLHDVNALLLSADQKVLCRE